MPLFEQNHFNAIQLAKNLHRTCDKPFDITWHSFLPDAIALLQLDAILLMNEKLRRISGSIQGINTHLQAIRQTSKKQNDVVECSVGALCAEITLLRDAIKKKNYPRAGR